MEGGADLFPIHHSSEVTGSMAVRCTVRVRYVCFAPGTGSRDDSSYRENVVVCDDSVASCGTGLLVADGDREGASACLGCGGEDSRDEQERQWEK